MDSRDMIPANIVELEKFIPSKTMCEYLSSQSVYYDSIPAIIFYSQRTLDEKIHDLGELQNNAYRIKHRGLIKACEKYMQTISLAKKYLEGEGVFIAYPVEYIDEITGDDESCMEVFSCIEHLKEYMESNWIDMVKYGITKDDCYFHTVSKYIKDEEGRYQEICWYIFVKGEPCYFSLEGCDHNMLPGFFDDINLPVPYKVGDILEIDNYPFSPKYRVIIIGVGDNRDCCCVQGIYKGFDGEWKCGAVKHKMLKYFNVVYYQTSPLYTANCYEGPFDEPDEELFPEIQRYLRKQFPSGDTNGIDCFKVFDKVIEEVVRKQGKR